MFTVKAAEWTSLEYNNNYRVREEYECRILLQIKKSYDDVVNS